MNRKCFLRKKFRLMIGFPSIKSLLVFLINALGSLSSPPFGARVIGVTVTVVHTHAHMFASCWGMISRTHKSECARGEMVNRTQTNTIYIHIYAIPNNNTDARTCMHDGDIHKSSHTCLSAYDVGRWLITHRSACMTCGDDNHAHVCVRGVLARTF